MGIWNGVSKVIPRDVASGAIRAAMKFVNHQFDDGFADHVLDSVPLDRGHDLLVEAIYEHFRPYEDTHERWSFDQFTEWRERLGLTYAQAAKELGVSDRTLYGFAHIERLPLKYTLACKGLEMRFNLPPKAA